MYHFCLTNDIKNPKKKRGALQFFSSLENIISNKSFGEYYKLHGS
jgi:hypothetical protein